MKHRYALLCLYAFILLFDGTVAQNLSEIIAARQVKNTECYTLISQMQAQIGMTLPPSMNFSDPVILRGGAQMLGVQTVSEVDGLLSVMVGLTFQWQDNRVKWFATECPLDSVYIYPASRLWLPWLYIENAMYSNIDQSLGSDYMLRIFQTGVVQWQTGKKYNVACDFSLDQFPKDTQTCELVMYLGGNVRLHSPDRMDLSRTLITNELWNVTGTVLRVAVGVPGMAEGFVEWRMRIHLQRNVPYYMYSLIVPTLTLMPLSALTFMLPPDDGGRLGAALTTLLTYYVMALSFFGTMPAANKLPMLASLFLFEMVMATFNAGMTTVIYNMALEENLAKELEELNGKKEPADGCSGTISVICSKITATRLNRISLWVTVIVAWVTPSIILIATLGSPLPPIDELKGDPPF